MSLTRSKALLELGRRLVAQLGAGDDLLASWMAHYIAERIEAAENASEVDRGPAQEASAKAILDLWKYRKALPDHLRTLGELEPIVRAIASLDVDQDDYRYYPHALREAATARADEETKQWLDVAFGLDYSARILIRWALESAAQRAASDAAPWVDLARRAGAGANPEEYVIEFVSGSNASAEANEAEGVTKLEDKLARLEAFAKSSAVLIRELRAQLGAPDSDED
ncbi:MAG: AVAST type 3 anti-phage protein Avs3b [Thiohalocapsa sp.]